MLTAGTTPAALESSAAHHAAVADSLQVSDGFFSVLIFKTRLSAFFLLASARKNEALVGLLGVEYEASQLLLLGFLLKSLTQLPASHWLSQRHPL